MRTAVLFSALMATLAMGSPLDKRYYVTLTDQLTVYTTVTQGHERPVTATQQIRGGRYRSFTTVTTVTVSATGVASSATPASISSTSTVVVPSQTTTPVVVAAQATTSVASSAIASATGGTSYQNIVLNQHNLHRANHSAEALVWDADLAAIAQTIGESCVYAHDTTTGGGGYGQNIGAGILPDDVGKMITNEMYNGEINFFPGPYGSDSPDLTNFEKWGHFSQIVWQTTTKVGCATVKCDSLQNVGSNVSPYFTVCNYSPPGNYAGEYSNVGAPLGNAIVTA